MDGVPACSSSATCWRKGWRTVRGKQQVVFLLPSIITTCLLHRNIHGAITGNCPEKGGYFKNTWHVIGWITCQSNSYWSQVGFLPHHVFCQMSGKETPQMHIHLWIYFYLCSWKQEKTFPRSEYRKNKCRNHLTGGVSVLLSTSYVCRYLKERVLLSTTMYLYT